MKPKALMLVLTSASVLVACESMEGSSDDIAAVEPMEIVVVLDSKSDSTATGRVVIQESTDGVVTAFVKIEGLEPQSEHGFHIHETGDCSASDAKSAGGHFAPDGHRHGAPEDSSRHLGDLGNVTADGSGIVVEEIVISKANVRGEGRYSILDKAFVLHAGRDDMTSQPSGAAGARIACGEIRG